MSLSATVTLDYSGNTVTLPAPRPGYNLEHERVQTVGNTAGGQKYVYDKAVTHRVAKLTFDLTPAQKAAFITWYDNQVLGSLYTFSYTDHRSVTHTGCRILNRAAFDKTSGQMWRLELEIDTGSTDVT